MLARRLGPGAVVLLTGDLGAGKTTLAKGLVKGLGAASLEEVSSPTFTLIHEYGDPPRVYHIDLYRLENAAELAGIGLDELFEYGATILVEWGEKFLDRMPSDRVEVRMRQEGEARRIEVTGLPMVA
jgi:tRNA threonylcarbamoyl adenosine modification protein YjeE